MSEEQNEPVLLICSPVIWNGEVLPGSVQHTCDECEQAIWVVPTGQRMMADGAKAVCVPCGTDIMAERGVEPDAPTDDQIKELKDALLRERL